MLVIYRDKLNILMETFYKEVEKLRDAATQVRIILCHRCMSHVHVFDEYT